MNQKNRTCNAISVSNAPTHPTESQTKGKENKIGYSEAKGMKCLLMQSSEGNKEFKRPPKLYVY